MLTPPHAKEGPLHSKARRLMSAEQIREVRAVFAELDTDRSGALDPDEVLVAVRRRTPDVKQAQVNEFITQFDDNGDGLIQLDEVRRKTEQSVNSVSFSVHAIVVMQY